nr:hypothetical protein [Actinomycetota bacterium]
KQAWFGQYTHLRGHEEGVGRRGFLEQAMRFLDRHVRGVRSREQQRDPGVTVQEGNGEGRWRLEQSWPPEDARPWTMPVRAGTYVDSPGNLSADSGPGDGTWTVTKPLRWEAHLAGVPVLRLRLSTLVPDVNVVAHLYDVAPDGTTSFVQRGAMAPAGSGEQEVRFALYPQDYRFVKGHRIALRLSASEDNWFTPGVSQTDVDVVGGSLTLPLLREKRTNFVAGGPSDGMDNSTFTLPPDTIAEAEVETEKPRPGRRRARGV